MVGKMRLSRLVIVAVILAAVECASLFAVQLAVGTAAQAQGRDDRYPFLHRQRGPGGFFQDLFGNPGGYRRSEPQYEGGAEHARAPSLRKPNKDVVPTTSVVVIGDGMAD